MRTTLILDDDVATRLEQERRKHRAGLDAAQAPERKRQAFHTKGFDLGPSLVGSLDDIEEVLSRAEGEDHR